MQRLGAYPQSDQRCGCEKLQSTLGRSGQFWQPDSYDHIVRTLEQLVVFRKYIADNPKKAGIVLPPEASYHADWMNKWLS